jgi:RNA-directed DNA polymerase
MIKASIDLQDLRRRLYVKAKAETSWRCWGLYVHVSKMETLRQAYALAKENDGAPGVDGSPSRPSRRKAWMLSSSRSGTN